MRASALAPLRAHRLGSTFKAMQGPLFIAIAYFVGAKSAFLVGTLSDRIFAPFWPPNVILFCVLVLAPTARWWRYILAVLPAHLIAELQVGMQALPIAVAFATNCGIALLSAFAVRRLLGGPPWLGSLKQALSYVLITAVASPAVMALGGALVPILGGAANGRFFVAWSQWFLSNSVGFLTLGPFLLSWFGQGSAPWSRFSAARMLESAAIAAALVVVSAFAFHLAGSAVEIGFVPALLYSPLPLILWSATRFGAKGASGAILVVTIVVLWLALNPLSLFVTGDPEQNVLALQIFVVGLSIPVLLLGAAIEEARRAVAATRESEERMQFAAASAKLALWYFERESGRFWATIHCRALLGLARDAPLTPEVIRKAIHPDDRENAIESITSTTWAGRDAMSEFRVVLPDGEMRWLRARARADRNDKGAPARISGVFMDISAAKAAEHEAELQRRELTHLTRVSVVGELSGALAHELNQPLTAMLSNAQAAQMLLDEPSPNLPELNGAITDIVRECKRASEVIGHMRGLLKKDERPQRVIDLNELIRSTSDLLHSELVARRLKLDFQLASDLPGILGDAVQLQQVLLNLLMNAMDAMATTPLPQRRLTVSTRRTEAGEVETSIVDRGTGLSREVRSRAFDPFFTTKQKGLGLGLSICSTILRTHGGRIALVDNVDRGVKASFTLPAASIAVAVQ